MTTPNQPLDLTPIKAYLEVAAKLGYGSGTGLRHMAALVDEVERLTNRLNWLERCMGQQTDFTGSGQGNKIVLDLDKSQVVHCSHINEAIGITQFLNMNQQTEYFKCVCCGQVASKGEAHRCEKGQT